MGVLVRHLLVIGVAIALEPVQIVAFIYVLCSRHGIRAGWAFISGWAVSLVAVSGLTILAAETLARYASDFARRYSLHQVVRFVELALGLGLVAYGALRLIRKAQPEKELSRLRAKLTDVSMAHAAVTGLLIPPWPLVAAGAVAVLRADLRRSISIGVVLLFCALATSSLLVLQLYAVIRHDHATRTLAALRAWVTARSRVVIGVLSIAVGVWLMVHAAHRLGFSPRTPRTLGER